MNTEEGFVLLEALTALALVTLIGLSAAALLVQAGRNAEESRTRIHHEITVRNAICTDEVPVE